ncbi:transcriptional regulator [Bifidobacterium hapali]|uniref:Transcriptional regulator n=1 Tax=Bifidobacterium hapali TaxID=1630172 RepID=A0A261G0F4_9BIFI|nr:MurR/RpiR family transcriptional regulator [Bifidobacterium hapali]OZG64924.1 transcriptional regulator [Bifidobacterium hapali]
MSDTTAVTDSPVDSPLLARLRAALPALGGGEQRVIAAMLMRPQDVPNWSTADVAEQAGTSLSTVVRACQRVGFRGYQHMRLEFARLSDDVQQRGVTLAGTGAGVAASADDASSIVAFTFANAIAALKVASTTIDDATMRRAADLLASAGRILCAATGFSAPPIRDAALRLAAAGLPVQFPADVISQQFCAHALASGDVCLAVSYSGANTHTLHTCRLARERGATVVAMTNFPKSPLAEIADVTMVTGVMPQAHRIDPGADRVAELVVLQALCATVIDRSSHTAQAGDVREVIADSVSDCADPQ